MINKNNLFFRKEKNVMKRILILFLCVVLCCTIFVGCGTDKTDANTNIEETVDYSSYPFVGSSWSRDGEHDSETIRFNADGTFGYSCGCGNPVNDSDVCEGYTYDDETKTIALICLEEIEGMVTEIKVVACSETELQLDFNGDIRIFTK